MRYKKKFDYGKGKYYLVIKSIPNNITMFRRTKEAAVDAFQSYAAVGKPIEWLGKWNGRKFVEDNPPVVA